MVEVTAPASQHRASCNRLRHWDGIASFVQAWTGGEREFRALTREEAERKRYLFTDDAYEGASAALAPMRTQCWRIRSSAVQSRATPSRARVPACSRTPTARAEPTTECPPLFPLQTQGCLSSPTTQSTSSASRSPSRPGQAAPPARRTGAGAARALHPSILHPNSALSQPRAARPGPPGPPAEARRRARLSGALRSCSCRGKLERAWQNVANEMYVPKYRGGFSQAEWTRGLLETLRAAGGALEARLRGAVSTSYALARMRVV